MRMPITTTVGAKRAVWWTASWPVPASATTSMSGSRASRMRKPARTIDWSSATISHLRVPWVIPGARLDTFIIVYPSKRYRGALIGIVVHRAQSVFFLLVALSLVLN